MDLRDNDSNIIVTRTTSGDNYFSEQALRAGLVSNEVRRSDFTMSSDPLREAFQRELEKERIREEIITSEIIRRREIEAEVRRELAFERELALHRGDGFSFIAPSSASSLWSEPRFASLDRPNGVGYCLPERLPFSVRTEVGPFERPIEGPFERLPFQRNPAAARMAEINKPQAGKVMLLTNPTTANLAGTKRKLISADGINDSSITPSKKKLQEWSCALCEVSTTSEEGLNMHLQGKKHKAKEEKLKKEGPKNTANSSRGKKNSTPTPKKDKKLEMQAKTKLTNQGTKRRFPFWCEDCQVGCHSEIVMDNHCKGKKHRSRIGELKQTGGTASSTTKHDHLVLEKAECTSEENREAKENIDTEVGEAEVETEGATETMESCG